MGHALIFSCDRCGNTKDAKDAAKLIEGASRLPEGWVSGPDPRVVVIQGDWVRDARPPPSGPTPIVEMCGSCHEVIGIALNLAGSRFVELINTAFDDPEWQPTRMERDKLMRIKERKAL